MNHYDRIGREIIITSMHLRMRFTQQRATVNPMRVRVIIFRQLNEMLTTADYNPYRLMETNKLENPWFIDSESRYDKDEVKRCIFFMIVSTSLRVIRFLQPLR